MSFGLFVCMLSVTLSGKTRNMGGLFHKTIFRQLTIIRRQVSQINSERFSLLKRQCGVKNSLTNIFLCQVVTINTLPVMAAVAVRKKVVSIGHFSPCFYLQSLNFFFVRSNQKQLYVLIALKIREK